MTTATRVNTGRLVRQVKRAVQLRRTRGNARVLYAIMRRVFSLPILRRCVRICATDLWRLRLSEARPPRRIPANFTVRRAEASDLQALIEYYGDAQRVTNRIERGGLCILARCGDQIGAAVWTYLGPNEFDEDWAELRTTFQFPAAVAWAYDGKGTKLGAWGTLMARLPELLATCGVEELATVIDCDNWQSIDAHRSLGFESVGIVGCLSILGLPLRVHKPPIGRWKRVPARFKWQRG